jgi:Spy/CpxP family protein refolding chaperone
MKKNLAAAMILVAVIAAPPIWAQGKPADATDMQALRTAVRADKKALVASTLQLTDAEAKKFWPIYDAYQRSLDAANRRVALVVEDLVELNRPLSDAYARNLAAEMVAADEAEIKARRTLHNRVMRALPPKKAARYMQLESKIRAFQDYDIATAIPLVK